jgi:arylsulfatase A-like enzyme
LLLAIPAILTLPLQAAEPAKPNVILIISEDQGFPDYGFMGSKAVATPNLDRMASEGLLYSRGYVMPVCSPSLATLLTGKMPHEHGITGNDLAGGLSKPGHREG